MTAGMLAQAVCAQGHTWDCWGERKIDRFPGEYGLSHRFIPAELQSQICPTCEEIAIEFRDPDNLT